MKTKYLQQYHLQQFLTMDQSSWCAVLAEHTNDCCQYFLLVTCFSIASLFVHVYSACMQYTLVDPESLYAVVTP